MKPVFSSLALIHYTNTRTSLFYVLCALSLYKGRARGIGTRKLCWGRIIDTIDTGRLVPLQNPWQQGMNAQMKAT